MLLWYVIAGVACLIIIPTTIKVRSTRRKLRESEAFLTHLTEAPAEPPTLITLEAEPAALAAPEPPLPEPEVVAPDPDAVRRRILARQLRDAPVDAWLAAAREAEPDDAYMLLNEAALRFPDAADAHQALAEAAEQRGDVETAERAWRDARTLAPESVVAAAEVVTQLPDYVHSYDEEPQLEESVAIISETSSTEVLQAPVGASLSEMLDFAAKSQWEEVIRVAKFLIAEGVEDVQVQSTLYDAYWNLSRHADAELCLDEGRTKFSENPEMFVKTGRFKMGLEKFAESSAVWTDIRERFSPIEEAITSGAWTLSRIGDKQTASQVLSEGHQSLPGSISIWLQYLEHLLSINEAEKASEVWSGSYDLFRTDHRASILGAKIALALGNSIKARELLRLGKEISERDANTIELEKGIKAYEDRELFLAFESLGGELEGCEFGLVQRHFGAEPLGLLRWTAIDVDNLVAALDNDFAGVGEPENTTLSPPAKPGDDWMTHDTRYGMDMHTFQHDDDTPESHQRLLADACRRLAFLKQEFLDELASGGKIFVYKNTLKILSMDDLDRLYMAIQRHGKSTLLYVQPHDAENPPGTVRLIKLGLLRGYIERFSFGFGYNAEYLGPVPEHWEPIIRAAYEMATAEFETA